MAGEDWLKTGVSDSDEDLTVVAVVVVVTLAAVVASDCSEPSDWS